MAVTRKKVSEPKSEAKAAPKATRARKTKKSIDELQLEESIRNRAYQIWEEDGRPHGVDLEHWLRAKEEVLRERE